MRYETQLRVGLVVLGLVILGLGLTIVDVIQQDVFGEGHGFR